MVKIIINGKEAVDVEGTPEEMKAFYAELQMREPWVVCRVYYYILYYVGKDTDEAARKQLAPV